MSDDRFGSLALLEQLARDPRGLRHELHRFGAHDRRGLFLERGADFGEYARDLFVVGDDGVQPELGLHLVEGGLGTGPTPTVEVRRPTMPPVRATP
jgi:hypothetical protein